MTQHDDDNLNLEKCWKTTFFPQLCSFLIQVMSEDYVMMIQELRERCQASEVNVVDLNKEINTLREKLAHLEQNFIVHRHGTQVQQVVAIGHPQQNWKEVVSITGPQGLK